MGDLLSQEEIDALMDLQSGDEENNGISKNIEIFTSIFLESAQNTLSTLLSKGVLLGTAEIASKTLDTLLEENIGYHVISQVVLDGNVQGPFLIALKQDDATIVVDLILMGEGVSKPEFTAEDEDGFNEAINQMLGAFTIALKENFSENIAMKQSGIFAVELSDASCPVQSLGDKDWKIAKIPFKIEAIIDTHLFLILPDVTTKQLENLSIEEEENIQQPPLPAENPSTFTAENKNIPASSTQRNIDILLDVELPISVRVGETEMTLQDILKLGSGSVIELNKSADSALDLMVNNKVIARGEVVIVDANFALRLTEIEDTAERIKKLG